MNSKQEAIRIGNENISPSSMLNAIGASAGMAAGVNQQVYQHRDSLRYEKADIHNLPSNPWVFKTLSMGGWDYEGNPILVVTTLELIKNEQTGKLQGSNVIFDFVDPKKPSQRVAVMTDSLLEVLEQIKGVYTMERLAGEDDVKKGKK